MEKEYEFKLTKEESQKILDALVEKPFNQVFTLVGKLQSQFIEQDKASKEEVLDEDAGTDK